MFISQVIKKDFKKPNILRKNAKVSLNSPHPQIIKLVPSSSSVQSNNNCNLEYAMDDNNFYNISTENSGESSQAHSVEKLQNGLELESNCVLVKAESTLNGFNTSQALTLIDVMENSAEVEDINETEQWCINLMSDEQDIVIKQFDRSAVENICADLEDNDRNDSAVLKPHQVPPSNNTNIILTIEKITGTSRKYFKCDVPDCNKQFKTEEKLVKHKKGHNKEKKTIKVTSFQCPAKSVDNQNVMCAIKLSSKEALLKHLKEDHTLEDAAHECGVCGRRFFLVVALRTHSRSHVATRPALRCAWPGCAREFSQPCRLREHARAHTGDRPYPCLYPECGWSFRSASKLVRHARRHTGERHHACDICPRAFRRREHLREHQARTHPENDGSKVENADDAVPEFIAVYKKPERKSIKREKNFVISLHEPSELSGGAGGGETGGCAARTHCPWPLSKAPPPTTTTAPSEPGPSASVEQLECSDNSNVYTIQSDLFLHGNILMNEDSQNMDGDIAGLDGDSGMVMTQPALDTDLGLLDTHPTIDLMQEQLLFTDVAVDESSFRIFMLNGDELE